MTSEPLCHRSRIASFLVILALTGAPSCSPEGAVSRDTATDRLVSTSEHEQLWGCGMHPHVIETEAGACPVCGMNLVRISSGAPTSSSRSHDAAADGAGGERKIAYWVAPMDPTFITDAPGKSPMGMDLVPVYEDEVAKGAGTSRRSRSTRPSSRTWAYASSA